jgi:hypothetical protein
MDYEGLCEDLLEMERRAASYAARGYYGGVKRPMKYLDFARECQMFRYELFLRGFGIGGY